MEGRSQPHHYALQGQQERSAIKVREQIQRLEEWRAEDAHLVGRIIVTENFTTPSRHFPNWQCTSIRDSPRNWTPLSIPSTSEGISLTNVIVKTVPSVELRSLGLELRTRFTLVGDSAMWVCTRARDPTEIDAVICKVSKDAGNQRIFVTLGSNLDTAQDFMFFRKQEIPETPKQMVPANDSTDIRLTYVDNGDCNISATVCVNEDPEREITMTCNKFVPKLQPMPVCLAVCGDQAVLKFISLKYAERLAASQVKSTHHEECCDLL
jgi:hypothetical protein